MPCEWCGCKGPEHDCYTGCGECVPCKETYAHDAKHTARGTNAGHTAISNEGLGKGPRDPRQCAGVSFLVLD